MSNLESIQSEFLWRFAAPPEHVARAPGRVNLIGEHTDYNGGFVFPMAIDHEAVVAARRRSDRMVRLVAQDLGGATVEFSLDSIERDDAQSWSNYVRGVALELERAGAKLPGLDLMIHSTVPVGSGLSSSAALEVSSATAFLSFVDFDLSRVDLALMCQRVENEFVGVKTGIMDQFISALARAGTALLVDCRALTYEHVPMPKGAVVVVCDTTTRRGLVGSEYNARRAECEDGARRMGVPLLRDVSLADFERWKKQLPPIVAKRCRHIVTENARVLNAAAAMRSNDLATLGRLMNESHTSLKDDYQVSSPALDVMVEIARLQEGCLGARLTGAGFGGCTVNLVAEPAERAFVEGVKREYRKRQGVEPPVYVCHASQGAGVLV
ncbi:MAG: galactokinase [Chloroflexi bacterium]|nr:galactokinase [Chloroflexota bacterium]